MLHLIRAFKEFDSVAIAFNVFAQMDPVALGRIGLVVAVARRELMVGVCHRAGRVPTLQEKRTTTAFGRVVGASRQRTQARKLEDVHPDQRGARGVCACA